VVHVLAGGGRAEDLKQSTDRSTGVSAAARGDHRPDMPTTSSAPEPVARLRGPGELAAALPHLCGFVPTESLVVVALHGPRSRVGLTMRVDLPPGAHEEPLVADVVDRLQVAGASGAMAVVCTEQTDRGTLPRAALVRRLRRRLRAAGICCDDALLVRAGRWWSYLCSNSRCCPPAGTPLATAEGSQALALVHADAVARGRAVLPSRADLVGSLEPPANDERVLDRLSTAEQERRRRTAGEGRVRVGRDALSSWRQALTSAADPPVALSSAEAAELAVSLSDVVVRDEVLTWLLDDADAQLHLLFALAALTPQPWDVPVCTLLGWAAHARGDGALANVALDRALAADPRCTLALLSLQALDEQLPPAQVRALLADSRRVLRAAHPWTAP
jgi:hypothetical protein